MLEDPLDKPHLQSPPRSLQKSWDYNSITATNSATITSEGSSSAGRYLMWCFARLDSKVSDLNFNLRGDFGDLLRLGIVFAILDTLGTV